MLLILSRLQYQVTVLYNLKILYLDLQRLYTTFRIQTLKKLLKPNFSFSLFPLETGRARLRRAQQPAPPAPGEQPPRDAREWHLHQRVGPGRAQPGRQLPGDA